MERYVSDHEFWNTLYAEGYFETADTVGEAADLAGVHYVQARRELSHAQNRAAKPKPAPGDREVKSLTPTVYEALQREGIDGVPWQEIARDDPPWFSPWPPSSYTFSPPLMDRLNRP